MQKLAFLLSTIYLPYNPLGRIPAIPFTLTAFHKLTQKIVFMLDYGFAPHLRARKFSYSWHPVFQCKLFCFHSNGSDRYYLEVEFPSKNWIRSNVGFWWLTSLLHYLTWYLIGDYKGLIHPTEVTGMVSLLQYSLVKCKIFSLCLTCLNNII